MVRRASTRLNSAKAGAQPRPDTPNGFVLLPEHLRLAAQYLEPRGCNVVDFERAGGQVVANARLIDPMYPAAAALVFPFNDALTGTSHTYEDAHGVERPFQRIKPLGTRGAKFLQPRGTGAHVYFARHPNVSWPDILNDVTYGLVISEGETRSLAGAMHDLAVISLAGVDCGQRDGELHPDLTAFDWQGRPVFLAFDSDVSRKERPQKALQKLATLLRKRGADVYQTVIPAAPDGSKQGLDDYLSRYGQSSFRALLGSPETTSVASSDADIFDLRNSEYEEMSIAEIMNREVKPVDELIPGWIERGVPNFLAGPGGVHKSRLALQWGLCINSGAGVWGLPTTEATLVYVSAEDDANEIARRAQAISAELTLGGVRTGLRKRATPAGGFVVLQKGKDSALVVMKESGQAEVRPFYHQMIERLSAIAGHKLVVLDSAYDFVRFAGRAKIDEDSVNFFIKIVLQQLCDRADCTLLIPWHPSQAGSERNTMDGWSVAWHNAPRARLALKPAKDLPDAYELSVAKRNHGPPGQCLSIRFHNGALLPLDALPDDGKALAFRRAVVNEAKEAARLRVPLNRRDRFPEPVVKKAEEALGRRPSKPEIKDALEAAVRNEELIYITSTRHRSAGYYPPDAELARELSNAARRAVSADDS